MTVTLTASAGHLAAQIGWVASHLPARPAIPVLAGLRLEATGEGRVQVTGTDYEVWAAADLDADTTGTGVAVLPGRLLAQLLAKLPPAHMVHLEIEAERARLRCGPTRASLRTLPAEDYPAPPTWPTAIGQTDAATLARAVGRVAGAASTDHSLAALTGVHIRLASQGMVLTATDRYRAARDIAQWEPVLDNNQESELLVPAATLAGAVKTLSGTVQVGITRNEWGHPEVLGLGDETRRLATRLLTHEQFPDADQLTTPTLDEHTAQVEVETTVLISAVQRARLFAAGATPLVLELDSDHLVVHGGADGEDTDEQVPAQHTGKPLQIAFNGDLLLGAVGALRSERVRMVIASPTRPVVLLPQDEGDPCWQLAMPIRQASAPAAAAAA